MEYKKNTYRERSGNTIGLDGAEDTFLTKQDAALAKKDKERLMKTRAGFFDKEPHTQESIMRGIEEGEVAEKNMVGRALNRLKTNVMGSNVDNELAAEREAERKSKAVGKKTGGVIKSSASKRADGCAIRGKTRA
jgi:hypothetical protein